MRRSLRGRLIGSFGLVVAMALVIGLAALFTAGRVVTHYQAVQAKDLPAILQAVAVQDALEEHRRLTLGLALLSDSTQIAQAEREIEAQELRFTEAVRQYKPYVAEADEERLVGELEGMVSHYILESAQLIAAGRYGEHEAAARVATATSQVFDQSRSLVAQLVSLKQEQATRAGEQADQAAQQGELFLLLFMGVALATGLFFSFGMARHLTRPIRLLMEGMERVAKGDLRRVDLLAKIQTGDEVQGMALAFEEMVAALQGLVSQVSQGSGQVLQATDGLTQVSAQAAEASQGNALAVGRVAEGAAEQNRLVAHASQVMQELGQAIDQVATGAGQSAEELQASFTLLRSMLAELAEAGQGVARVTQQCTGSAEAARTGGQIVERAQVGMEQISAAVAESGERVVELANLSAQIGQITASIGGLSEQTNLLALNAAIEAARAGEHGRGFSVVAEEVRRLAERSMVATREITDLILAIQQQIKSVVQTMEVGSRQVQAGRELSAELGRALQSILAAVERSATGAQQVQGMTDHLLRQGQRVDQRFQSLAALAEEHSAATEEMAAGVGQVIESLVRIATLSEENAGAAQEVSAFTEEQTANAEQVDEASQQMRAVAEELQRQVSRFEI